MLYLKLFGGASLETEAGPVSGPAAQRRRLALLAVLAVAPTQRVSRDRLIGLLWPEEETARARHFLADSVYALRSGLGKDAVLTIGDDLHLNPEIIRSDVAQFMDAVRGGERERAADLYAGPWLDGFFLSDAPEFEQWVEAERSRLSTMYARVLEELAEEREARGDFAGAIPWWRRLAATDRFSSRVALRLMLGLEAAGDPAAALEFARIHEALLRTELDAEPSAEVRALVERLQTTIIPRRTELPPPRAAASDRAAAPEPTAARPSQRRARVAGVIAVLAVVLTIGAFLRRDTGTAPSEIRSLAVLPLENISGDPGQEYFADGMTEELTTELARYRELRVVSRTSAMRFKGARRSVAEIARELGVDAVVEGSVLRDQGRVRITAQLIHAASDRHLWAESYERDVRDVIDLQAEVALAIAREVHAAAGGRVGSSARQTDPLAHELLLRGRYAAQGRGRPALEQAQRFYQQAIARDSGYAEAYAALADVFRLFGVYAYRPVVETNAEARAMVENALRLDPQLAAARALKAQFLADDFAWESALAEFQHALQLDPANALTHHRLAMTYAFMARWDDALRAAQRAATLDPLSGQNAVNVAVYLQQVGREKEAEQQCRKAVALDVTNPWPHYFCGIVHLNAGRLNDATTGMREAERMAPGHPMAVAGNAVVAAAAGDSARARTLLQQLLSNDPASHPFQVALVYAALGNHDAAFAWFEREPWIGQTKAMLRNTRVLDPLRTDPRYERLLKRLRLPR